MTELFKALLKLESLIDNIPQEMEYEHELLSEIYAIVLQHEKKGIEQK